MNDFPLSRREWQLLTALWELGQATADEIFAHCNLSPRLKRSALECLLKMVHKRVVMRSEIDSQRFEPCLNRVEVASLCVRALLTQGFAGPISEMLAGRAQDMNEADLEELEKLIQDHRNRSTDKP